MNLKNKTVLITGANRGIGAALVRSFLDAGAGQVWAGMRDPSSAPKPTDPRVTPFAIDITNPDHVDAAAKRIGGVDILVNNAGIMSFNGILSASERDLPTDMDVNFYGTVRMMKAFAPLMAERGGGVIANLLSIVSLSPISPITAYSASKAALLSATQAARAELAAHKIKVVGIFPGPVDTDLAKNMPMDKATPAAVAQAIVDGIAADEEDIFPDGTSKQAGQLYAKSPKELERYFGGMNP